MPTLRLAALALAATVFGVACVHEVRERPARALPAPPSVAATPVPAPAPAPSEPLSDRPAIAADELIWPVRGKLASKFGTRRGRGVHEGIDILAKQGTPVRAAAAGRVRLSGWMRGYGNLIILEHERGLETRYAHLHRSHVRKGDRVERGRVIGEVGRTGNATTSHLHFEVRERTHAKNPLARLASPDAVAELSFPASLP
jgi:murein DD-endopeptidase MepM/ murein hydrolase activator NlpD